MHLAAAEGALARLHVFGSGSTPSAADGAGRIDIAAAVGVVLLAAVAASFVSYPAGPYIGVWAGRAWRLKCSGLQGIVHGGARMAQTVGARHNLR